MLKWNVSDWECHSTSRILRAIMPYLVGTTETHKPRSKEKEEWLRSTGQYPAAPWPKWKPIKDEDVYRWFPHNHSIWKNHQPEPIETEIPYTAKYPERN